jgi:lysine/ornithine N-monooxygenase
MEVVMKRTVDLLGVGFGPANIALAVALHEHNGPQWLEDSAVFLERRSSVSWHPGMLLEGSRLQVTFLKDFALLRNPTSAFTFLNYLKVRNRLDEFANLRTLFPSRHEFDDYMKWVASHFVSSVRFNSDVVEITPYGACSSDSIARLSVKTGDGSTYLARNLVLAVGARKKVPAPFVGKLSTSRVVHSIDYLEQIEVEQLDSKRVVVVGSGQSAAEITYDLLSRTPRTQVTAVFRDVAYRPPDESQFSGEVYFPGYVDQFHNLPGPVRADIMKSLRGTNYSVVDPDLLHNLYKHLYDLKVRGLESGFRILNHTEVTRVENDKDSISLECLNRTTGLRQQMRADVVILATGFDHHAAPELLASLNPYVVKDAGGSLALQRDYRVTCATGFEPGIYVQGAAESTHGPADTLLSLSAVRAGEIAVSLMGRLDGQRCSKGMATPGADVVQIFPS